MRRRSLFALAAAPGISVAIGALFAFACTDTETPARGKRGATFTTAADAIATTSGTSGTIVVPIGAYVTSWWAHAAAGGAGGTVTIAPTGPREYPTCYTSAAATCRDAGPAITIPAGAAFSMEVPVLAGNADELGAGTTFIFSGTDSYAITVNGPGGSADAAAPPSDAGASDAANAADAADAADSGQPDAGNNMPLVLTPNEAPATLTNGTVTTKGTFANGGSCGTGTPTVVLTGTGYTASGTSVACTSGVVQWVNPAYNSALGTSAPGFDAGSGDPDITVTISTTGGACPSGCSSTGIANSMHFAATNNPIAFWFRGDNTNAGTAGGAVTSWPSLFGLNDAGALITLHPAGDGGVSTIAVNGIQAPTFDGGVWMAAGGQVCPGSSFSVTLDMVACAKTTDDVAAAFVQGSQPSGQAAIGLDPATTGAGIFSDLFIGSTTSSNTPVTPNSCHSIGSSLSSIGANILVLDGVITPGSRGALNSPSTDFYIGNYRQSNADGPTYALTAMDLIGKCKGADNATDIIQTTQMFKRIWNTN